MAPASTSPEISLLVPIYNVERYLEECLRSAQQQTFRDIEVLCINDGSTDGSRGIIERFAAEDARFRLIDKENSGYGASMNRGLDEARGRYLAILESDDFLDVDALATLHAEAQAHHADVVKEDFFLYWSSPHPKNERFGIVSDDMVGRTIRPTDDPEIFYAKPSIWSCLFRADFLRDHGIRFTETPGASYQDAGFNFKVWACADRVRFLQSAHLHYRQDNESSSVNAPGKVYCVCDEYQEIERFLAAHPDKKRALYTVEAKAKYDSYMWNYERLAPQFQLEFIERVSREFNERIAEPGGIDLTLFEPWKLIDFRLILRNPAEFNRRRQQCGRSRLGKTMYYLRYGGPRTALQIIRRKYLK